MDHNPQKNKGESRVISNRRNSLPIRGLLIEEIHGALREHLLWRLVGNDDNDVLIRIRQFLLDVHHFLGARPFFGIPMCERILNWIFALVGSIWILSSGFFRLVTKRLLECNRHVAFAERLLDAEIDIDSANLRVVAELVPIFSGPNRPSKKEDKNRWVCGSCPKCYHTGP